MKPNSLDRREQFGLVFGLLGLALVILMALYIPSGPLRRYRQSEANLDALRQSLSGLQLAVSEQEAVLKSQESFMQRLQTRPSSFEFYSFMNALLQQSGFTDRYTLNNAHQQRRASPKQPMLDLELTGITLEELVNFLHKIYASENLIVVQRVTNLQPGDDGRGLDCEMTLATVLP